MTSDKISIVQLCHFTIATPIHGGQRRVFATYQALKDANFDVHFIGFYNLTENPDEPHWKGDFQRPPREAFTRGSMLLDDYNQGIFCAEDDATFARIVEKIRPLKPDIFLIEHPWLYPIVKRLKQDIPEYRDKPMIHSSLNIEWRLKANILAQYQVKDIDFWAQKIKELEIEAAHAADLNLVVTEQDGVELSEFGARNVHVFLNGMEERPLPKPGPDADDGFALFVGSGHPPNVRGFMELVGPYLAFLPPNQRIRIVGSVCAGLKDNSDYKLYRELNDSRIEFCGEATEQQLLQSLSDCRCIILPITESSGSNLKTAEALLAGKPIVASRTAMRGYERFMDEPTVVINDTAQQFKKSLQNMLAMDKSELNALQRPPRNKILELTWNETLKGLDQCVHGILAH